ncbi:hypothetical protein KL86APRO_10949 [uncultured Alphaproteobacteria bacterium]|uniref:Uncharacterized protein n=1 Tax=uncultured Alphaproteobacteria bacterium TaxID=91750 RepID=A0A212JEU2_9PROT|nr:hypothetical protein KL86APRO_10949 [uncultured Alphaproteobacteria bacterium]
MSHLAPVPRFELAVEVQLRLRVREDLVPAVDAVAEEVLHLGVAVTFGGAEAQIADRAHELLELVGDAGVHRPMAGIVRTRRHFVDENAALVIDEHLDRQQSFEPERGGGGVGDRGGASGLVGQDLRGCARGVEDVVDVDVLDDVEGVDLAARRPRDDHRDFLRERHEAFEDRGRALDRRPRVGRLRRTVNAELALAVVSQGAGLEDAGGAEVGDAALQAREVVDLPPGRGGGADAREEGLFGDAVLCGFEHRPRRAHQRPRGEPLDRRGGNVLELEGDHVHRRGEGVERLGVVVGGGGMRGGHRERRGVILRTIDMAAVAEARGGERRHPAELAAAENTDRRSRRDRRRGFVAHHETLSKLLRNHRDRIDGGGRHRGGLVRPPSVEAGRQRRVFERENRRREERRVDRARLADRKRADRDSARHLHDREEAVHSLERVAFHRNAEHRQRGHRRGHPRQVRRAARAGDDHLEAAVARGAGVVGHAVGGAVGGNDPRFVGNFEGGQGVGGVAHGLPVRLAAHDDADGGLAHDVPQSWKRSKNASAECNADADAAKHPIGGSGDDVGVHLRFEADDLVLEHELALLQTLYLQLVGGGFGLQAQDYVVEIAVLEAERFEPAADIVIRKVHRPQIGNLIYYMDDSRFSGAGVRIASAGVVKILNPGEEGACPSPWSSVSAFSPAAAIAPVSTR